MYICDIHANGFSSESANGWEVYTSPGEKGLIILLILSMKQRKISNYRMRKDTRDGDPDKESNFYVLVNTAMPRYFLRTLNDKRERV